MKEKQEFRAIMENIGTYMKELKTYGITDE